MGRNLFRSCRARRQSQFVLELDYAGTQLAHFLAAPDHGNLQATDFLEAVRAGPRPIALDVEYLALIVLVFEDG